VQEVISCIVCAVFNLNKTIVNQVRFFYLMEVVCTLIVLIKLKGDENRNEFFNFNYIVRFRFVLFGLLKWHRMIIDRKGLPSRKFPS
jgi:hypothetical protein